MSGRYGKIKALDVRIVFPNTTLWQVRANVVTGERSHVVQVENSDGIKVYLAPALGLEPKR